jgi:hypothetical protein
MPESPRQVDVVILTAITLEYQQALKVDAGAVPGSVWEQEPGPNGLPVAFRSFTRKEGRPLRVAVAQAGDMEAVAATNVSGAGTLQMLRPDGTVWNTGSNLYGERGFLSNVDYGYTLEQVLGLTGVVALSAQGSHVHALRSDGTVVSWGSNAYATMGNGVSPLHLEPTQVLLPCRLSVPNCMAE